MTQTDAAGANTKLREWLAGLGLEQYAAVFAHNAVDMEVLGDLTEADLAAMDIALGHRKKLLRAMAAQSAQPTVALPTRAARATADRTERRQLTVMICDIVDSTGLTQRLDPEELRIVVTACMNACLQAVALFGGHVARLLGDGLKAYFGYPLALEDAAERAVHAALQAAGAVSRLDLVPGTPLNIRVGVATGLVVVGDLLGEGAASEEVVFGETPAMATRLQTLAGPGQVLIAPTTRRLLGETFELEFLGPQSLKGIRDETPVWRVLGGRHTETRFDAAHGEGIAEFVGREDELALLGSRWQSAANGEGQVVLLSGEPGIGKSRLCQRLHEDISATPHTLIRLQCSPFHVNSALYPLITNLERAAGLRTRQPTAQRRERLAALLGPTGSAEDVAILSALLSIPPDAEHPEPDLAPRELKQRTLDLLCNRLLIQSRRHPVLCLVEDVHWADPTTLELVALVIDRLEHAAALMLVTFRPDFTHNWTSRGHVTALNLNRLRRQQTADLVARLAGEATLPPDLLEHIVAKTDGVPLFIEELTRSVIESGVLADHRRRDIAADLQPPFAIPETLQDSLLARLDRLAPIKEIAQVAAVIGREFTYDLMAIVSACDAATLQEALGQLAASGLIHAHGFGPGARFSFKHALVRDVTYSTLLLSRRSLLHTRIAEALRDDFPAIAEAQPELVAHHLTIAGLAEAAVEWWRRAGERAIIRSAHAEAIGHLSRARDLLMGLPPAARVVHELDVEVLLGQAMVETRGYGAPETMQVWQRARALLHPQVDPTRNFAVFYGLWAGAYVQGDVGLQQSVAAEAKAKAESLGDSAGRCVASRNLGTTLVIKGEFAEGRQYLERALSLYDEHSHRPLMFKFGQDIGATAMSHLCLVLYHLGLIDQALAMAQAANRHAAALHHPHTVAYTSCHTLFFLDACRAGYGDAPAGAELVAHCRKHGFRFWGAIAQMGHCWAQIRRGEIDIGMAGYAEALQVIRQSGTRNWLPVYLAIYAQGWALAGDTARARSVIDEAIGVARGTGEVFALSELLRLKSDMRIAHQGSWQLLQESLEIARGQGALCFELRTAVDMTRLAYGRAERDQAGAALRTAYGRFTEGFDAEELKVARAAL